MNKSITSVLYMSLLSFSGSAHCGWSRVAPMLKRSALTTGTAVLGGSLYTYNNKKQPRKAQGRLQVVYSPDYDIGFLGIEKLHPFDSCKYSKVFAMLQDKVQSKIDVHIPDEVSDTDLERVHTAEYLAILTQDSSRMMAQISEIPPLSILPNWITRRYVQKPMRLATGGTVLAAHLALQHGKAVNLSGGYHHAKAASGEGFCAYADIPLAVYKLIDNQKVNKVLVVDLDAHQGNGMESIFADDKRVDVFDVYNAQIYPRDFDAAQYIRFKHPVRSGITDNQYLQLLKKHLAKAIKKSKPDLIVYNAGTDIYEQDRLGQMSVSAQGIVERDAFVFKSADEHHIPIVMVLSGGYTKESAHIIGQSLINLVETRS